jgi:phosphoribosylamine--glycine ligase
MPSPDLSNILVIGSGGREHALAWALARSDRVARVYVAPGNGGTAREPKVENVAIGEDDFDALTAFAREHQVGLTVVGPEKPLELGVVDAFRAAGLPVFGPTQAAARIESSKAWARDFMRRHGIPHPHFTVAEDLGAAGVAIRALGGRCVVKADGLAAGKGVVVCNTVDEALAAARGMLEGGVFGQAGTRVLIEERIEGPELSVMAITDGTGYALLPPAQDHKRLLDGDRGPNTGGMGAYAPAPIGTPELLAHVRETVIEPVLVGMRAEGHPFTGCLFCGLMLTDRGPMVIEFNGRFGDPETQVQLPLIASDFADLLRAAAVGDNVVGGSDAVGHVAGGGFDESAIRLNADRAAVVVALASGGYPGQSESGRPIHGLDAAADVPGVKVFHAGTRIDAPTGETMTAGGRVLGVVCVRETLAEAVSGAYAAIAEDVGEAGVAASSCETDQPGLWFAGMQYRRDIAGRALEEEVA